MTYHDYKPFTKELQTHIAFIGDPVPIKTLSELNFGDVIRFWYAGLKPPYDGRQRERLVFILNPEYKHKMHALDMAYISHNDLVETVVDEMYQETRPREFYHNLVGIQHIVKRTDAYRTYFTNKLINIERLSYRLY